MANSERFRIVQNVTGTNIERFRIVQEKTDPICYRFPQLPVCGCTIPCRKALKDTQMWEIIPKEIFLGSVYAAIDRKTLEANNVKLVLNVSNEKYTAVDGITYQTFDALDEPSFNLQEFFPRITNMIHSFLEGDDSGAVLVHCRAGVSRSVSAICAYLIEYKGHDYDSALALIKKIRPRAQPNAGFERQLRAFAADHAA